jgi:predicted nucleotide-binding protein (sugar kinase/HSP70/actin superfamily)
MKLTIKKFQELQAISTLDMPEFDKAQKLVECLTDKTTDEVEAMPLYKFDKLCKELKELFDINVEKLQNSKPKALIVANGKPYHLNFNIMQHPFNAGRYVEIATFATDTIGNMHNILASMATPLKWSWRKMRYVKMQYDATKHEQYANDMLHADFEHAYHSSVFFYLVFIHSIKSSKDYLVAEMMMAGVNQQEAVESIETLLKVLDGCITQRWYQNLKQYL